MSAKRETIKFLIPVSTFGISSQSLNGRSIVPLYINPQNMTISDSKIIQSTQTKGGFIVEYWGENLTDINFGGVVGSGGIEAIEILRSVYRNEQTQMRDLILRRMAEQQSAENASQTESNAGFIKSLIAGQIAGGDSLLGNGFSEIIDANKSLVENIKSIYKNASQNNPQPEVLIPTAGAFAVTVDMYYQGFKYRGFFSSFSVSESADVTGDFNYDVKFSATSRTGKRSNFAPWHRDPYDSVGQPKQASIPTEGPMLDELSFRSNITETAATITKSDNQAGQKKPNQVLLNRFEGLKK